MIRCTIKAMISRHRRRGEIRQTGGFYKTPTVYGRRTYMRAVYRPISASNREDTRRQHHPTFHESRRIEFRHAEWILGLTNRKTARMPGSRFAWVALVAASTIRGLPGRVPSLPCCVALTTSPSTSSPSSSTPTNTTSPIPLSLSSLFVSFPPLLLAPLCFLISALL
ncbi:hypothetical protein BDY17DRAFT_35064 [Neohortaea acidophila]|uniref:Uncharacterized protein n=1 Tax=Neohortaea acidophila TaxID=245834 RepID=A0A6A6PJL3_9PEZI|nr:uncharacterized protein BDY17DRAFT_35064 [Neohortaea acidophila]KAF2480258.1 hypothetical protein BDY17DRAFT_35064 [Neohortaea acidophila]